MKQLLASTLIFLGTTISLNAQKNAIGLRLSDNAGFGAEVSYQRDLSKLNRLEANLGFKNYGNSRLYGANYSHNEVKLTGIYQWVFEIKDGFKWYVGPGAGLGAWDSKSYYNPVTDKNESGDGVYFVLAGDVGIEYTFDFPLQLSVDFRPEIYLSPDYVDTIDKSFGPNVGISARYKF